MAWSVNTRIGANRQRREVLFGFPSAFRSRSEVFVFRGTFVSPLQRCVTPGGLWRRKGKARADVAGQLVPVPAGLQVVQENVCRVFESSVVETELYESH